MVFRLVGLEIEVQRDHRPEVATILLESLLDERFDASEEVLLQRRLRSADWRAMRNNRPARRRRRGGNPDQILLDRDWQSRRECSVEAIRPTAVLDVRV